MLERATDSNVCLPAHERTVVLLLPELLAGEIDAAKLRATLTGAAMPIRVLLCLTDDNNGPLLAAIASLGLDVQILLGPEVTAPATTAFTTRALSGTSTDDLTELALAFCDIVVMAPEPVQTALTRNIASLGKTTVVPGAPLRPIDPPEFAHCLDPDDIVGWRRAWGRKNCGRFEQGLLELLAFNWLGRAEGGISESKKRLRRCLGRHWGPSAYFAPDKWKELVPDRAAVAPSAKIVRWFDILDRSALYGSYIHRDLVWHEHFGAAFAVLFAVAGALTDRYPRIWGVFEFVTLFAVGAMVLWVRHSWLQDRWTACRFGAEQLRIARMSLPLLVLPPVLATKDTPDANEDDKETQFEFQALTLIKRVVREQGLPQLDANLTPLQAAQWLDLIVSDQITYHHRNERKLDYAEVRLRFATQTIFFISVVAVVAHFFSEHAHWLLLFTAAGPAFAAALQGTITRLGIVHRAALSVDAAKDLRLVHADLAALMKTPPPTAQAWSEVRRLAYGASRAMGRENTSWHGLVRRYRDDL